MTYWNYPYLSNFMAIWWEKRTQIVMIIIDWAKKMYIVRKSLITLLSPLIVEAAPRSKTWTRKCLQCMRTLPHVIHWPNTKHSFKDSELQNLCTINDMPFFVCNWAGQPTSWSLWEEKRPQKEEYNRELICGEVSRGEENKSHRQAIPKLRVCGSITTEVPDLLTVWSKHFRQVYNCNSKLFCSDLTHSCVITLWSNSFKEEGEDFILDVPSQLKE